MLTQTTAATTPSAKPEATVTARGAAWGRVIRSAAYLGGDIVAILLASVIATNVWAIGVRGQAPGIYTQLWPFAVVLPAVFLFLGLYPGSGLGPVETLRRIILGTSGAFAALGVASFLFKAGTAYSRGTFLIAWSLSLLLVPLFRGLAAAITRYAQWNEPAILVGHGPLASEAQSALASARFLGYTPALRLAEVPTAREAENLAAQGYTTAILALPDSGGAADAFRVLEGHFGRIVTIRGGAGLPVDGVRALNLGGVLGTEFRDNLLIRRNQILKRAIDLIGGSGLLLISLPLVGIAALAIKIADRRGPVFFSQERGGFGGIKFRVHKIRTMCADAEERLERELDRSRILQEEWNQAFKLSNDPRIIPGLGRWLRRWSIDELPQFWSVVKGDMSLVGPRPFPEYHLRRFSPDFRQLRARVRPGLTGLWQVIIRSDGSLQQQVSFDTYYIRNWSIWLDFYIVGRTIVSVLTGRGAR